MTKKITKLRLSRETVRQLDGAPGGGFMATSVCSPTLRPQTGTSGDSGE